MRVLVAGAATVDAGKTTFSVGLLERTGAIGYKPRAGNDFWFDHDDYRDAVERDRLYGKDARRLAAASAAAVEPEEINPIHRLWRPSPGGGAGLLGRDDREFLVDRVGDRFVVNDTVEVPDSARERLSLSEASRVSTLQEFNDLMARLHAREQEELLATIRETDRAVVESYADVARPVQGLDPDAVAVVEPRRVRVYDGPRYGNACAVASGSPTEGRLEERVSAVVDLADPETALSLPALSAEERRDSAALADAYEHAYDRLLAVAGE